MSETGLVEYEVASGDKVKLSPTMIKKYLVSGGGNVTDQETMMFLMLCKGQKLNPFLREAYLIKFGNQPATMVTGKDVFTKRAQNNPNYAGKQAGIIVQSKDGNVIEREGSFKLPEEKLVGGWAKVFIKGHEAPEYASVAFEEYVGRKKDGEVNGQWKSKPATMIRKVALVQALREAFPDTFQGLYDQSEMTEVSDVRLDEKEVTVKDIEEKANAVEFPTEEVEQVETVVEVVDENDPF